VGMNETTGVTSLQQFRTTVYEQILGRRKDSLFELMEAALSSPGPVPLVRLSLAPAFRRGWASAPDALADGTLKEEALRGLLVRTLPPPPDDDWDVWALDGSTWPRPHAATSAERTYAHRVAAGQPQHGVVPGWEYQWLVALPARPSSWILPLDVRRRTPDSGSPTALAVEQLRAVLPQRPAGAPRPVVTFDSGYDPVQLAEAKLEDQADLLVRLARHRVFYRAPGPYRGRGRPAKHGAVFRLKDPATQEGPSGEATVADPASGRVTVTVWSGLHVRRAPGAPVMVARITVERLPGRAAAPAPWWLAWIGGLLPADLLRLWHGYRARFGIEHGFRFGKQALGWTTVRPQTPAAADRWTWLLVVMYWQLWLARALVADQRLPWEPPLPAERLTPGRVRRAFGSFLSEVGTPARAPQPRGKAPGRRLGERPGPRRRHPVVRRRAKQAA
jgi:Transposase DDE domain